MVCNVGSCFGNNKPALEATLKLGEPMETCSTAEIRTGALPEIRTFSDLGRTVDMGRTASSEWAAPRLPEPVRDHAPAGRRLPEPILDDAPAAEDTVCSFLRRKAGIRSMPHFLAEFLTLGWDAWDSERAVEAKVKRTPTLPSLTPEEAEAMVTLKAHIPRVRASKPEQQTVRFAEAEEVDYYSPANASDCSGHRRRFLTATSEVSEPEDPIPEDVPEAPHGDLVNGANLGAVEGIATMRALFVHNINLAEKINQIEGMGISAWRRARGDGNCFWRSAGFATVEAVVLSTDPRSDLWFASFMAKLQAAAPENTKYGADHQRLLDCLQFLRDVRHHPKAERKAAHMFNQVTNGVDLAMIRALRLLTARWLVEQRNSEEKPIEMMAQGMGYSSIDAFNERICLAMGVEAEELIMVGFPEALEVRVKIICLYRERDVWTVGDDEAELKSEQPLVHVMLRMGHYDQIYMNREV